MELCPSKVPLLHQLDVACSSDPQDCSFSLWSAKHSKCLPWHSEACVHSLGRFSSSAASNPNSRNKNLACLVDHFLQRAQHQTKGKKGVNNNYAANTRRSISHFGNAPAHCCEHADGASARVPASSVAEKRCQMPQNQLPGFGLSLATIKSQRYGDAMLKLRMAYDDITNILLSKHSQHRQSQSLAESHGWGTAKKCEPLVTKGK